MESKKSLLLIDGTALLVRSQLAVRQGEERATELALFFLFRSVIRFVKYHDPAYVLVAWDGEGGKDWRREYYPEYKANRSNPGTAVFGEDDLGFWAHRFFTLTGIYQVRRPFEADDIIAWAAWRAELNGIEPVVIRSDDADLYQLIRGTRVTQYGLSGPDQMTDEKAVVEKYGCSPRQLPVLRALAGDPSDNIPGIHGVGLKTARKLCADASYDLLRVKHPLLDEEDSLLRPLVLNFAHIMDLGRRREAVHEAMGRPHNLGALCRWDKTAATPGAVRCFEALDMKTLVTQALSDSLW